MDIILVPLLKVIFWILNLYIYIIVISVIFDWLRVLNIINPYNNFVRAVGVFLGKATYPIYSRISRIIPPMGGIDLSPFILILMIYFIQEIIIRILLKIS